MGTLTDHLIDDATQEILSDEYEANNYAIINASRELPDSRYYTYDINILEEFLAYVNAEASERNITDVKIRICMGQYPDSVIDNRMNPDYKGYQNTFIVAGTGEGNDFEKISGLSGLNLSSICPPPSS